MSFFSWLIRQKKPKIKVGLALGSGGAKGFAHLGALRAFEDNGIEIDAIAGTSIGSIIGAFYCDGYSSVDILELLSRVDFSEIVNPVFLNMDTIGLFKVIDREIGSLKIEELKKPFCAVATEIESGKERVFSSGSVADALCASCCMPPFFRPKVIDGKRYVDGAYTNSIPADVVKRLGVNYVIGIDLKTETKQSVLKKIIPTYKSNIKEPWKKGYDESNVMLHPDLNGFSALSFGLNREIYDVGYRQAIMYIPKIKKDLELLKRGKRL